MRSKETRQELLRHAVRQVPVLILGASCLWFLAFRADQMDLRAAAKAVRLVELEFWLIALGATVVSYLAIGRYDGIFHRHIATSIPGKAAVLSGAPAVALSQTLGFGLLTGTIARWRLLPALSLKDAFKVTVSVSAAFMASWAMLTSLVAFTMGVDAAIVHWLALGVLMVCLLLIGTGTLFPQSKLYRALNFPNVPASGALLFWTAVDLSAASIVFIALFPQGTGAGVEELLPAFLIAFGVGLISGMPGGVGAFELTLMPLLPTVPAESILTAVMGFRLIYFAVPALVALISMVRPLQTRAEENALEPAARYLSFLETTPNPESKLLSLTNGHLFFAQDAVIGCKNTKNCLVGFLDASLALSRGTLRRFKKCAQQTNRTVCFYKISEPMARNLETSGWRTIKISSEAAIDASRFHIDGPEHRNLRRKLRHAAKAGLVVTSPEHLPIEDMQNVDRRWVSDHGDARGFSMGQFSPGHVQEQKVLLGWIGEELVAFVTFHRNANGYSLDLMRYTPDCPDGTMHRLIVAAIGDANAEGLGRVSLAAVPLKPFLAMPGPLGRISHFAAKRIGATGLLQFKSAFGPTWEDRYMAAPSYLSLAFSALEIVRAVHCPYTESANMPALQDKVE